MRFFHNAIYYYSAKISIYHTTALYIPGSQLIEECCSITLSCRLDGIGTSV